MAARLHTAPGEAIETLSARASRGPRRDTLRRRKIESFKEKCAARAAIFEETHNGHQPEGQRGDPLVDAEPDTPLLYVLRNDLELNGAKFGCGLTQCGACTVLVNGAARRSCVTP